MSLISHLVINEIANGIQFVNRIQLSGFLMTEGMVRSLIHQRLLAQLQVLRKFEPRPTATTINLDLMQQSRGFLVSRKHDSISWFEVRLHIGMKRQATVM